MSDFPWLTLVIFLPLIGVPVLLLAKGIDDRTARGIGVGVTVLTLLAAIGMLVQFDTAASGQQLVDRAVWVRSLGLQYAVGVDGVSVWLVMLTVFMMPVAIAHPALDVVHRVVEDARRDGLLAAPHQAVDELAHQQRVVAAVGLEGCLRGGSFAGHKFCIRYG